LRCNAIILCLLAVSGAARADTSTAREIKGGEHPGFRAWARGWAARHHGAVNGWWSADLDGDGLADNVAELCVPPSRVAGQAYAVDGGIYLIEDASGHRFVSSFDDSEWNDEHPECRTSRPAPQFKRTADRVVLYDPSEKRGHDSSELALRAGQLVVTAEHWGGFHLCDYQDDRDLDWVALERHESHQTLRYGGSGVDSCAVAQATKRDEAILLVTAPGAEAETFFQVVRGKDAWSGASDASVQVAVTQRGRTRLSIRTTVTDDIAVAAVARTREALDAADHLQIWVGTHSLRLARGADGVWFALPGHGTTAAEVAQATVQGDETTVEISVPIEWADWGEGTARGTDPTKKSLTAIGLAPERRNADAWVGSLVVAFADVDSAGAGASTVISTAPVPQRGEPRGLLVKLPHGDRWPTEGSRVRTAMPVD
jgi:hypothetical protein